MVILYIQNLISNAKNVAPNPGQRFFTRLYCLYANFMSPVAMKQKTQIKCLTTKIDVCKAHLGCKTEKDAFMKGNSAKASKMCALPFTQPLPLLLSNER